MAPKGRRSSITLAAAVLLGCAASPNDSGQGLSGSDSGAAATSATSATGGDTGETGMDPGDTGAGDPTADDSGGPRLDVSPDDGPPPDCTDPAPTDAAVTGTVYAPNQELPIPGALVYATSRKPDGIPDEVYCQDCVELECDVHHTLTEADGSFQLDVASGTQYLVVQKGQFMRVTELDVAVGATSLPASVTSLPRRRDPSSGRYIPNIALVWAKHDRLEDALGKLGLGEVEQVVGDTCCAGRTIEKLVPDTEPFDVWQHWTRIPGAAWNVPTTASQGYLHELLADPQRLAQYHVLFVPCTDPGYVRSALLPGGVADPAAIENLRQWVAAGGKLYAADWSFPVLDEPFGQYQTMYTTTDSNGNPKRTLGHYDSIATILDADLVAWLDALPPGLKDINPANGTTSFLPQIDDLPRIDLRDLWSAVDEVHPVPVGDGNGGMIDVGHKTWIEGPATNHFLPDTLDRPHAMTGQYGCGRLMFSTFHMTGTGHIGLTPQELLLMYLILEINLCQTPYDPPPPEG